MSFRGKRHAPEALAKISEANKLRVRSEASKAKTGAALKGHATSKQTREKLRATMTRPEVRVLLTGRPRKPLTPEMLELLRFLAAWGRIKHTHLTRARVSAARWLRRRGYLAFNVEERDYSLTDLGHAAIQSKTITC